MSHKKYSILVISVLMIMVNGTFVFSAPDMKVPDDLSSLHESGLYDQGNTQYIYRQERLKKSSPAEEYGKPIVEEDSTSDVSSKDAKAKNAKNKGVKSTTISQDESEDLVVEEPLKVFGKSLFASAPLSFSPGVDVPVPDDYRISNGDIVEVVFWSDISPSSVYQLQVDSRGSILLPSIGSIPAVGSTIRELEQKVMSYVSKKVGKVEGFVRLAEVRNIKITVSGEAVRPGQYSVSGLSSAFNAIYVAGGPGDIGSMRNIKVIRAGKVISIIDFYSFLLKGIPEGDISLQSGDVVHIPVSNAMCSVYGEVKRPAIYELKEGDRLSEVLEIAGGLASASYSRKVKITRYSGEIEPVIIDVNAMAAIENPDTTENIILKNGDRLDVFPINMELANMVNISGPVKAPGSYQASEGMSVKDIVSAARGFDGEVFMSRGDVFRRNADGTTSIVSFDLSKALDGDSENNILLQPYDEVVLYKPEDASYVDKTVTVLGEVKEPGKYKRSTNMTVADLLNISGGVSPQAAETVEVARVLDSKTGETEINHFILHDVYSGKSRFNLQDGDVVMVKKIQSGKTKPSVISILGEVVNPGHYALMSDKETISSIIKRSGGLTEKGFSKGAVFIRPNMSNINMEQSAIVEQIAKSFKNFAQAIYKAQSSSKDPNAAVSPLSGGVSMGQGLAEAITQSVQSSESLSTMNQNAVVAAPQEYDTQGLIPERILIRFNEAVDDPGGYEDLVMRDGDVIVVPERPSTVIVSGAVVNPASFPYIPGQKMKFYLGRAGGYAADSNPGMSVIVRANGEVYPFKSVNYIEEGDIIIVPWIPAKLDEKTDKWSRIQNISQFATSILTSIYVLDKLGN